MHFNIDFDQGTSIQGWFAPDNFSRSPTLLIVAPNRPEIEVIADIERPDVLSLGVHATGNCGFTLNAVNVPGIAEMKELQILDAETRTPLYGRFVEDYHLAKKFFLFDCSITPQRRILDNASDYFSVSYSNIEQFGLETTLSLISNHAVRSLFATGRPLMFRYDHFLKDRDYVRAALLRDPFDELAERLLFMRLFAREGAGSPLAVYASGLSNLTEFAGALPLDDDRALTLAFRSMPEQVRTALISPMTKVFGCDIDEIPRRSSVSRALDHLASLDVVGMRANFGLFKGLVASQLGVDVFGPGQPVTFQSAEQLATRLARIGPVADLLAEDLALYSYVSEAIDEGVENAGFHEPVPEMA